MTKQNKENLTAKSFKVRDLVEDWFEEGLRVIIMRGPASFCTYIGIPESHPLAGFSYDDIPVSAHGGLTFARKGNGKWPKGFYWYGWDYAHLGDRCYIKGVGQKVGEEEKDWTIKEIKEDAWETICDFKRLARLVEKISKQYD